MLFRSEALTVDNSVPSVSQIGLVGGITVLTLPAGPAFTVTFSEPVENVTTSSFSVAKGAGTTGTAPVVSSVTGGPVVWTVTLGSLGNLPGGLSGDYANGTRPTATLGLAVIPTGITDRAGNPLSTAAPGKSDNYFIDRVSPTFDVAYSPASPVRAGNVRITATSSEPLPAVPTISIDQQGDTDINPAALMSGTASGTVFTYDYLVQSATGGSYVDGTATVRVSGTDHHGNQTPAGTTPTSGGTFVIDTTAPAVTLAYSDGGSANATGPYKSEIGRAHV